MTCKCNCKQSEIKKELDRIHRNRIKGAYKPLDNISPLNRAREIQDKLRILRPDHKDLMLSDWRIEKDYGSSLELWEYAMNDLNEVIHQLDDKEINDAMNGGGSI